MNTLLDCMYMYMVNWLQSPVTKLFNLITQFDDPQKENQSNIMIINAGH